MVERKKCVKEHSKTAKQIRKAGDTCIYIQEAPIMCGILYEINYTKYSSMLCVIL